MFKKDLPCQRERKSYSLLLTMYQVLGPHLSLIQPPRGVGVACLTFQMKKKIQRLNNTLTKDKKKTWDHLVYPGELGYKCKTPRKRERQDIQDKQAETKQKVWARKGSKGVSSSPSKDRHKHRTVTGGTRARQEAQRVSHGTTGVQKGGEEVWERSGVCVQGSSELRKLGKPGWYVSCHVFKISQSKNCLEMC